MTVCVMVAAVLALQQRVCACNTRKGRQIIYAKLHSGI